MLGDSLYRCFKGLRREGFIQFAIPRIFFSSTCDSSKLQRRKREGRSPKTLRSEVRVGVARPHTLTRISYERQSRSSYLHTHTHSDTLFYLHQLICMLELTHCFMYINFGCARKCITHKESKKENKKTQMETIQRDKKRPRREQTEKEKPTHVIQ